MAFDKPFLDLDKQLDLLESRNLVITNRDRAKRLIMTSSYYDLINGYKSVFMSLIYQVIFYIPSYQMVYLNERKVK